MGAGGLPPPRGAPGTFLLEGAELRRPYSKQETASFLLVEAVGARASKAGLAGWLFVFETPLLFFSAVARCRGDQLFAL